MAGIVVQVVVRTAAMMVCMEEMVEQGNLLWTRNLVDKTSKCLTQPVYNLVDMKVNRKCTVVLVPTALVMLIGVTASEVGS
jgi:hypothetical protein